MNIDLRFEPFITDPSCFYVFCGSRLVAAISKSAKGWSPINGARVYYKTALMAAFADAHMSSPAEWQ